MTQTTPALDPQHLAKLQHLTREYSRFNRASAGLGSVLGGVFAFLILAAELAGHGWRITLIGAFAPLPFSRALPLAGLPFLWLGCVIALRAWWYQRHGIVEAETLPDPRERFRRRALAVVAPVVSTAVLLTIFLNGGPMKFLRAGLFLLLQGAFLFSVLKVLEGRLERVLGALLFIAPALILAGIQMAALDSLAALPIVGALAVLFGLREHLAFRRVERELAALQGLE
jgi:MFS family permease